MQPHLPATSASGPSMGWIGRDLWQDLRYGARVFSKQPAFAAAAVLTLALGIGATTAIFSVVYGVLLKPLPFPEPERLVSVQQIAPHGAGTNHGPGTYLTYRENQQVFEAIGAWDRTEVSITGGGDPERVQGLLVSASTLPLLRVQPVLGRSFSAEDDAPGAPPRVMLTHGYWQRRFAGADKVIGQQLVIDGTPAEVIGVLPASFSFLRTRPAIVLPMPLDVNAPRFISFGFQALARMKPGITLAQANADAARVISLLPPAFARLELRPNVRPLATDVIRDVGQILWILLAAVGVVLLIACGNVANLFLVRAEGRHQELAVRAALGASQGRIARALLSESGVLALAGGLLGVVLAQAAIGLLRRIAPAELPRVNDIGIDLLVLLFTFAVSVLSGALCGALAVIRFGKPRLTALKEGGRSGSDGPGPPPHARCAGRRTNRAGAHAVDRVGTDDSNIHRDASGRPWLHPSRGRADVRARDTGEPHRRSTAGGAHVRGRSGTAGACTGCHLGRALVVHHHGRRRQRQLRCDRGISGP